MRRSLPNKTVLCAKPSQAYIEGLSRLIGPASGPDNCTAMDEKPSSSSWDDILKEVGATPAPDAVERRRPAIENTFDPPPNRRPAPKTKPGNWNALATELGVDAPPEEPAERAAVGPGAMEASFAAIEPLESGFEEIIEEEMADVEFGEADDDDSDGERDEQCDEDSDLFDEGDDDDSDEHDEDDEDDSDEADEDDEDELDEDDSEAKSDLPPSTLSGEAARSAFEALFQAGSFAGGVAPQRRPPSPPKRPETADDIFADFDRPERPAHPSRAARPTRPVDDEDAERGPGDEASRADEDEGEKRPRRRRRRGGRGRGPRTESADAATPRDADAGDWSEEPVGESKPTDDAERDDDSGEAERDDRPRRRRRSRRGRGRGAATGEGGEVSEARPAARNGRPPKPMIDDDDEQDDADDLALAASGEADDDDDASAPRSAHKSIPTWSEAILVMVETNMQSRKNAPPRTGSPRGQGPRGQGRGRGRGRGGRGGRGGGRPS